MQLERGIDGKMDGHMVASQNKLPASHQHTLEWLICIQFQISEGCNPNTKNFVGKWAGILNISKVDFQIWSSDRKTKKEHHLDEAPGLAPGIMDQ